MTPPDTNVAIRDAGVDELPAVRTVTQSAYADYATIMSPEAWAGLDGAIRSALGSDTARQTIVAVLNGAIVGSVLLFPPATDAYAELAQPASWPELRLLAVASEARGHGVGKLLVEECIRRARLAGATALGLHTSESMRNARQMYLRMGFIRLPASDFQASGSELVEGFYLPLGDDRSTSSTS